MKSIEYQIRNIPLSSYSHLVHHKISLDVLIKIQKTISDKVDNSTRPIVQTRWQYRKSYWGISTI